MTLYFRWIQGNSPALQQAKTKRLFYPGQKAFFVFRLDKPYRPNVGLVKGRVLVAIELDDLADDRLNDEVNQLDFEEPNFDGEAGHPDQVIVKSNEAGAYGIGQNILTYINGGHIKSIRLATKKELAKALGKSELEVPDWVKKNPQKW